jgi:hypothetical protein
VIPRVDQFSQENVRLDHDIQNAFEHLAPVVPVPSMAEYLKTNQCEIFLEEKDHLTYPTLKFMKHEGKDFFIFIDSSCMILSNCTKTVDNNGNEHAHANEDAEKNEQSETERTKKCISSHQIGCIEFEH